MKKSTIILSLMFVAISAVSFGQKIVNVAGAKTPAFLKGESNLNVEFDYSDMSVGKFESEEDYVNKKVEEYNKDEAGRGDKWHESWLGARERVYQPKFMELLNKGLAKNGISAAEGAEAKYTLIVHTTFTEPGFNVGVVSQAAAVSFEYIFVETANRGTVVAKYTQAKVPGAQAMGMDFDTSTRISESYAKGGKMLAGFIAKSLK